MTNSIRTSSIFGVILTLVGSFLPWRIEGDFISFWTYGIQIYPATKDNGGFLFVLLTLFVTLMVFRPPKIIRKPQFWGMLFSLCLVLGSVFHISQLFISQANNGGVIGAPIIQPGLIMVFIGSILLLFSTAIKYFKPLI
jgi:hypothetical protein